MTVGKSKMLTSKDWTSKGSIGRLTAICLLAMTSFFSVRQARELFNEPFENNVAIADAVERDQHSFKEQEQSLKAVGGLLVDAVEGEQRTVAFKQEQFPTKVGVDLLRDQLKALGITQYDVYRGSQRNAVENPLPLVVLVHHREFYVGCHSFERFINPRWETIFVLEENMAEQFKLKQLAQASPDTPGVHLALLNQTSKTGEWFGRKVALQIMKQFHSPPPLILSGHCDIHPLPEWHAQHVPFEGIVERMVTEFLQEDELNQIQRSNINERHPLWNVVPLDEKVCTAVFSSEHRPLLSMNLVMVESLPSTETLEGSIFHALEVGLECPWKTCSSRPRELSPAKPWMSDVSTFVEDHFNLYNVTLLAEIVDPFAMVHGTVNDGVRAIPLRLCQRGWKIVRLNDTPMFYDFGKKERVSTGLAGTHALFDPAKYGSVSLDWLVTQSVIDLADLNSPLGCFREYMRLRIFANMDVTSSCIIAHQHLQSNHLPDVVWELTIRDNEPIVTALMKIHGYERARQTQDSLVYVSVPSYHTQSAGPFVKRLKRSDPRVSLDRMFTAGSGLQKYPRVSVLRLFTVFHKSQIALQTITLDMNSMLSPDAFFDGYNLGQQWNGPAVQGVYSVAAFRFCEWIKNSPRDNWSSSIAAESLPLTPNEVLHALSPIADNCAQDFVWVDEVTGAKSK
jgi:hypothetical protein